jgi:hypothetical protein
LGALLLGGAATTASAQANVSGVVIDAATRRPVADVEVRLDTARAVTAATGGFRVVAVAAGSKRLELRHLAYASRSDVVRVADGDHIELEIQIAADAIRLAPLEVDVRSQRLMDAGFYKRSARGIGMFLTRAQIEDLRVGRLSDVFVRIPGARRALVDGEQSRIDMRGGKSLSVPCATQYFLDGVFAQAGASILDNLLVHHVEGMEVYRGASEMPTEFDYGRASCGAIVIWTRRR